MRKSLWISVLLGLNVTTINSARGWTHPHGGSEDDWGYSCRGTVDGGAIYAGSTESWGQGDKDLWLFKTDSYGEIEWMDTYGDIYEDYGVSILSLTENRHVVLGQRSHPRTNPTPHVFLFEIDTDGNIQWQKLQPDMNARDLIPTSDGGFVVLAQNQREDTIILVKTDWQGNIDRKTLYAVPQDRIINPCSICEVTGGGYTIVGSIREHENAPPDLWWLRVFENGDTFRSVIHGGDLADEGFDVVPMPDTGCLVVGRAASQVAGSGDLWLLRLD